MSMMSLVTRLVETVEQKIVGLEERVFANLGALLRSTHLRMTEDWEGRIKALESRIASLEAAAGSHVDTTTEVAGQLGDLSQAEALEQRLLAAFAPVTAAAAVANPGPLDIPVGLVAEDLGPHAASGSTADATIDGSYDARLAA